jgi:hypothetical protein
MNEIHMLARRWFISFPVLVLLDCLGQVGFGPLYVRISHGRFCVPGRLLKLCCTCSLLYSFAQ